LLFKVWNTTSNYKSRQLKRKQLLRLLIDPLQC
jgi:hypothetical protein